MMKNILFFIVLFTLSFQSETVQGADLVFRYRIWKNEVSPANYLGEYVFDANDALYGYSTPSEITTLLCPGDQLIFQNLCSYNGLQHSWNGAPGGPGSGNPFGRSTIGLMDYYGCGGTEVITHLGDVCDGDAGCPIDFGVPRWDNWNWGTYKTVTIPYYDITTSPNLVITSTAQGIHLPSCGCTTPFFFIKLNLGDVTSIEDKELCPGEIVNLDLDPDFNYINWHPYNPDGTVVNSTTEFTVDIVPAVGGACPLEDNFKITIHNPGVEFTDITELCYDEVFTKDDYYDLWTGSTIPLSIIIDGETYDENDFPIEISGASHGAGIVTIEYEYAIGTITCTKTYEIEIFPEIVIDLPNKIQMCDSDFETLCGPLSAFPSPIYTYEWHNSSAELLSTSRCFTPTMPGEYTLTVTDENGCVKTHLVSIVFYSPFIPSLPDVSWCPEDLTWPVIVGWLDDPFEGYPCTPTYQWTYNDVILTDQDGYNVPFMGNGTYCVLISFEFFSVTRCFEVEECCAPNPEFSVNWVSAGDGTYSMILTNVSSDYYVSDTYYLEKDCNNDGLPGPWEYVDEITRVEFDDPAVFTGLDPNCLYRITHRVPFPCKMSIYVHTEYVGGNPGAPNGGSQFGSNSNSPQTRSIYPNPTSGEVNLFIENLKSPHTVSIYNSQGQLMKLMTVNDMHTAISLEDFEIGIYLLKVSGNESNFTTRIVKI
ncbi:MAG: T9SS type A sorting domain-containing protein [Chitinophagales bacterium]|nr:T9SS type A sorting domain-containing protein [Chitinophagales bacterium]